MMAPPSSIWLDYIQRRDAADGNEQPPGNVETSHQIAYCKQARAFRSISSTRR
jgi:hypothetical protein